MTGYQVAKLANKELAANNLKTIPPQMVYNYIKKGYIKAELGVVSEAEANRWIEKYVATKLAKQASNNSEIEGQIQLEV